MRVRPASDRDRPAIEAHLGAHAERAMFPLSNLLAHGMGDGHPRAMRFWIADGPPEGATGGGPGRGPGGRLGGVLGLTAAGFVQPVLPAALAGPATDAMLAAGAGGRVLGIMGEAGAARAVRSALGLDGAPARLDHEEPHLALDLGSLRMPAVDGLELRPIGEAPRGLMAEWGAAYDVETLGAAPEVAAEAAQADLAAWTRADSHRALWRGGVPVARTGFNARAPGIVQVGGVFVPPALRGQGLARAAVALHLREARRGGARRATLFSATDAASRAYGALGFQRIGAFLLCLFDGPQDARA